MRAGLSIEYAFGILKNRFTVLNRGALHDQEDEIARTRVACVILHNMCLEANDTDDHFLEQDYDSDWMIDEYGSETSEGIRTRNAIVRYIC